MTVTKAHSRLQLRVREQKESEACRSKRYSATIKSRTCNDDSVGFFMSSGESDIRGCSRRS